MERLSVRLTDRMFRQLDALALERGITRTRLVRQLLEAGLRDRPPPPSETPSEDELLDILAEKAPKTHARPLWPCSRRWRRGGSECVAVQCVQGARAGCHQE